MDKKNIAVQVSFIVLGTATVSVDTLDDMGQGIKEYLLEAFHSKDAEMVEGVDITHSDFTVVAMLPTKEAPV